MTQATSVAAPLGLAERLRKNRGNWNADQLAEIRLSKVQDTEKARTARATSVMEQIRDLGYIPKFRSEHNLLAQSYSNAAKSGLLTAEQIQEAEALTAAQESTQADERNSKNSQRPTESTRADQRSSENSQHPKESSQADERSSENS